MSRYMATTKKRYTWGIGVACSILLLAIAGAWALEGRVGIRMRSFGSDSAIEVQRKETPFVFWIVVGGTLAAGMAGVAFTAVGLARVQREEADPAASDPSSAQHRSGPS